MYEQELNALKRAGRFRQRIVNNDTFIDCASNDYLGLSLKKKIRWQAFSLLESFVAPIPKASQLVNGYHPIHKLFEEEIANRNNFDKAMVVGSGFLANLALFEALIRHGDTLIVDNDYHASGMMATKLTKGKVLFFHHNDASSLQDCLNKGSGRIFVAVEGIYSMSGKRVKREILEMALAQGATLIIDEAHSSGVIGKHLLGILDYYNINSNEKIIKMGTLGKAYGAYGAYILASYEIITFLENRAKSIIYTTSPSVYETAVALYAGRYIEKNSKKLIKKLEYRLSLVHSFGYESDSPIVMIPTITNQQVINIKEECEKKGYQVGAIRPPTVKIPSLRVIAGLNVKTHKLKQLLSFIHKKLK